MRTFAVGDIHGKDYQLKTLIEKMPVEAGDRIVFVGDYVDRGNKVKEVVDYLLEISNIFECIFLRGNHEDMMLAACLPGYRPSYPYHPADEVWLWNGGMATITSYGSDPYASLDKFWNALPDEHRQFFEKTKRFYQLPEWYFVHAGLFDKEPMQEDPYVIYWTRYNRDPGDYTLHKNLVYGHTPDKRGIYKQEQPQGVTMYGIDTGCGKGGKLTGFCIDTLESWDV